MCIYYIYQYAHCPLALPSEPNTTCGGRTVVKQCEFAAQGGECGDVHGWTEIASYEGRCLPCRTGLGKHLNKTQAKEIGGQGWQWAGDKFERGVEKICIPVPPPTDGPPRPIISQKKKRVKSMEALRDHLVAVGGVVGRVVTSMSEWSGEVIDPRLAGMGANMGGKMGGFKMETEVERGFMVKRQAEVGGEMYLDIDGKGVGFEKTSRANGLSDLGQGEIAEGKMKESLLSRRAGRGKTGKGGEDGKGF